MHLSDTRRCWNANDLSSKQWNFIFKANLNPEDIPRCFCKLYRLNYLTVYYFNNTLVFMFRIVRFLPVRVTCMKRSAWQNWLQYKNSQNVMRWKALNLEVLLCNVDYFLEDVLWSFYTNKKTRHPLCRAVNHLKDSRIVGSLLHQTKRKVKTT